MGSKVAMIASSGSRTPSAGCSGRRRRRSPIAARSAPLPTRSSRSTSPGRSGAAEDSTRARREDPRGADPRLSSSRTSCRTTAGSLAPISTRSRAMRSFSDFPEISSSCPGPTLYLRGERSDYVPPGAEPRPRSLPERHRHDGRSRPDPRRAASPALAELNPSSPDPVRIEPPRADVHAPDARPRAVHQYEHF